MSVSVLCIEHLHPFDARVGARPVCPVCGCRFVRLAGRHGSQADIPDANVDAAEHPRVRVEMLAGQHRVGGDTWLDNKQKFVRMVNKHAPDMSDADIARSVQAWHPKEEQ